jgi:hypothetical protein
MRLWVWLNTRRFLRPLSTRVLSAHPGASRRGDADTWLFDRWNRKRGCSIDVIVMAGLVQARPGHPRLHLDGHKDVDARHKAGHGEMLAVRRGASDQHDIIGKTAGETPDFGNDHVISHDPALGTFVPDEIKRHAVAVFEHERIIFDLCNVRDMDHEVVRFCGRRPLYPNPSARINPACQQHNDEDRWNKSRHDSPPALRFQSCSVPRTGAPSHVSVLIPPTSVSEWWGGIKRPIRSRQPAITWEGWLALDVQMPVRAASSFQAPTLSVTCLIALSQSGLVLPRRPASRQRILEVEIKLHHVLRQYGRHRHENKESGQRRDADNHSSAQGHGHSPVSNRREKRKGRTTRRCTTRRFSERVCYGALQDYSRHASPGRSAAKPVTLAPSRSRPMTKQAHPLRGEPGG